MSHVQSQLPQFTMDRQLSNNFTRSSMSDKMLASPTFTDSTDEPTPMSLFTKGKGFKFNMNLDEDMNEGIGFDDNMTSTNIKNSLDNQKD